MDDQNVQKPLDENIEETAASLNAEVSNENPAPAADEAPATDAAPAADETAQA